MPLPSPPPVDAPLPTRPTPYGPHAVLTLGTVQLGMAYGAANRSGQPDLDEAGRIVGLAVAAGVTAVDTARAYGDSEARLGALLDAAQRARVTLCTKLAPLPELDAAPPAEADVVAAVDASVEASRAALRCDHLPVLLLHRPHHRTAWAGAAWRRLAALRAAGVVGRLGVSVNTPDEALEALDDPLVTHLQLPFNLLDHRWTLAGVPQRVRARPEVTVHARSCFLQGILLAGPEAWPLPPGEAAGWLARLDRLVGELALPSRAALCVGYALAQAWLTSVVVGVETAAQLRDNLALAHRPPLTAAQVARCDELTAGADPTLLTPSRWPRRP